MWIKETKIMQISNNYILVEKLEESKIEGSFTTVDVQDNFVYKGKVKLLPEIPVFMGNKQLVIGDTVLWAKYSPDTHEYEKDKFVAISDLLAVL